ncbi:FkbM family methyltransferase [Hydrotalea sp.]|uniref:FkbM family methyltransferase n=1 Tax=Hydrotalea sp. TaxID=2881279 RepID=UPI003D1480CE
MDFKKPQFYFNPKMLLRRLLWRGKRQYTTTSLGFRMHINPNKVMGKSISQSGVYDLVLTEVLFRLCRQANLVIDIGANIGYTVGVAAMAMNEKGRLFAFEPNPEVLPYLNENVLQLPLKDIQIFACALSDRMGEAFLQIPQSTDNEGLAHITPTNGPDVQKVITETLDHILSDVESIDVMKMDVEGHECSVLMGGKKLLSDKKIKHIIFEDHASYPSEVAQCLMDYGYSIFRLEKGWFGVQLKDPTTAPKFSGWEPVNYLATSDVQTVDAIFTKKGYQCLRWA